MKNKNIIIGIGILITIIGVVFLFLPHDIHNQVLSIVTSEATEHSHDHEEHGGHDTHQLTGILIALVGIILSIISWKKIS